MKTVFAKIVDGTFGLMLTYLASFAVLCYFLPRSLAALAALSVSSALFLLFGHRARAADEKDRLSRAADDMFFNFMFESDCSPARRIKRGLERKGIKATVRADALYVNGDAAFFRFDAPLSEKRVARDIARAKKYGADTVIEFCKLAPALPQVDGVKLKAVHGEDTYKLFASLGALPQKQFGKVKRKRFAALRSSLDKDRIPRYLMLALALGAVAFFTRSVVWTVCAALSASLFAAAAAYNIAKNKKHA